MNRATRLLALLCLCAAPLAAQDPSRWDFFVSLDWDGRLALLSQQPAVLKDGAFLLKALDLVDGDNIEAGTDQEVAVKSALATRVVQALAETAPAGAAAAVDRLPRQYKGARLRGESWLALARLGERSVVPAMVRALANANDSGARARSDEIQASYLVNALALLKAPESLRTMTAAALAWYSPASGVRAAARRALPSLVPDFDAAALDLLATDDDLKFKEGLYALVADLGRPDLTARAASAVLGPLVRYQARDQADQDRTERLTLACLLGAQKSTAPPPALITPLSLLLGRLPVGEVTVQSVRTLAKIGDPAAAAVLIAYLDKLNGQQKKGTNTTPELLLVKEVFSALGATGRKEARRPLEEAKLSGYTPAYVQLASEVLGRLPRD